MTNANIISLYIYFGLVLLITLLTLGISSILPSKKKSSVKLGPYESGIRTETHLFRERFPLRHYLIGLIFIVFDVEIIFLYPWAVIAKKIGAFAFYEMAFFLIAFLIGFIYFIKKKGLGWD